MTLALCELKQIRAGINSNLGTGRVATHAADPLMAAAHIIQPYLPGGANVHAQK